MATHKFELVGGHAALDFVNTIHDWTVLEPRDHIPAFSEALRFGAATRLLSPTEARRFTAMRAGAELRRLRELRGRLERILRASVVAKPPLAADLAAITRDAADAARTALVYRTSGRLVRVIDSSAAGVATLRWRLVEAALALLTSPQLTKLKTCPSCGWFFLDTSKNGSRRWCSMAACGSNAKARRYYWRKRMSRPR